MTAAEQFPDSHQWRLIICIFSPELFTSLSGREMYHMARQRDQTGKDVRDGWMDESRGAED